jgi:hypothetical protein
VRSHTSLHQYTTSIYEARLFVCFVLFVLMRSTEQGGFRQRSWSLWKALDEEGCMGLVHDVWTCGAKVLEYWMISSLKIKLNCNWKFPRNVPLVLLEISWRTGFNGISLGRFGFRWWGILVFKWFLPLKIQINFKKPGSGRKNQLRTW